MLIEPKELFNPIIHSEDWNKKKYSGETKVCKDCKVPVPIEKFNTFSDKYGNYRRSICNPCVRKRYVKK